MTEQEAVREEFYARYGHGRRILSIPATVRDAMADEIVQQRRRADRAERILAALREPSEGMMAAVLNPNATAGVRLAVRFVLDAAAAFAEQEVGGDERND